jgi:hypothetical protein
MDLCAYLAAQLFSERNLPQLEEPSIALLGVLTAKVSSILQAEIS